MAFFPDEMREAKRWLVRDKARPKQPYSPYRKLPGKSESDDSWRWSWTDETNWANIADCIEYANSSKSVEGLSFVVHPGTDYSICERIICLDLDNAIDNLGKIKPTAQDFIDLYDSFAEFSRSGNIHIFVKMVCAPFRNSIGRPLGDDVKLDILCNQNIAVTGRILPGSSKEISTIPYSSFSGLIPKAQVSSSNNEMWAKDSNIEELDSTLIDAMCTWAPSISGQGGHNSIYSAACFLAKKGVVGWDAVELLRYVPADPEWSEDELIHKVESAFEETQSEGTFDNGLPEFDIIDQSFLDDTIDEEDKKERPYNVYSLDELFTMDLTLDFAVEGAFVDKQPAVIGGHEKCFKTGVAMDLLVSLVTGEDFLGRFKIVDKKEKALFFTAEIGIVPAMYLGRRVLKEKRVEETSLFSKQILIGDFVPAFHSKNPEEKKRRHKNLNKMLDYFGNPPVVCFDPMYLAMGGAAVGDMYEIGEVLRTISDICHSRGIWPIFCHHASRSSKNNKKEAAPMVLSDLYGSGVAEFARQWLLLSHRVDFSGGVADMFCRMGGSATGDLGLWNLKISEGMATKDLSSRTWKVDMSEYTSEDKIDLDLVLDRIPYEDGVTLSYLTRYFDKQPLVDALRRLEGEERITLTGSKYTRTAGDDFDVL